MANSTVSTTYSDDDGNSSSSIISISIHRYSSAVPTSHQPLDGLVMKFQRRPVLGEDRAPAGGASVLIVTPMTPKARLTSKPSPPPEQLQGRGWCIATFFIHLGLFSPFRVFSCTTASLQVENRTEHPGSVWLREIGTHFSELHSKISNVNSNMVEYTTNGPLREEIHGCTGRKDRGKSKALGNCAGQRITFTSEPKTLYNSILYFSLFK